MIVSVAMNARGVRSVEGRVCIMLDVLRASSTMLAMFEAGARELRLAETPEDALEIAEGRRDEFWVCGERDGLKVPGFDFGNSPVEVDDANLAGREVVYVTSNGTGALRAVAEAPLVLVGSPRNEVAVVRHALREATANNWDILILCAGDNRAFSLSLEDTFVAGMLVERLVKLSPRRLPPEEAATDPMALGLSDSAIVAHRLFRSYLAPHEKHASSETIRAMFAESRSGRDLPSKGYGADLLYCSEIDVTTVVPHLELRDGRLVVVAQGSGDARDAD
ncbi:MAG: 2-phosphosulfolactate phosphatase [Chloroflexi bacterium]|nr:2-phosphosulfolactate phosphatase [Chloroflexota bacterium]